MIVAKAPLADLPSAHCGTGAPRILERCRLGRISGTWEKEFLSRESWWKTLLFWFCATWKGYPESFSAGYIVLECRYSSSSLLPETETWTELCLGTSWSTTLCPSSNTHKWREGKWALLQWDKGSFRSLTFFIWVIIVKFEFTFWWHFFKLEFI